MLAVDPLYCPFAVTEKVRYLDDRLSLEAIEDSIPSNPLLTPCGWPHNIPPMSEHILVIRLGALGDLVLCCPSFQAIRRAHPAARVALVRFVHVAPGPTNDVATLDRIFLRSPTTNGQVPLSTFAKWTTDPVRPLSISHQSQFPAITISFNLGAGVALGQATEAVNEAVQEIEVPPTIARTFQGNAQAFQDSLSTVPMLIVGALIVVYLVLGILYESYIHPLTILSTLPSAGVGAFAMLMLFGFDFSLIALIGLILLIGIVKKNGIMLVDFAIVAERTEHLSAHDAVRKAALLRFRPIMMTTFAALLGGVPLMLGTGTGSEIRQPLGYAMVGGLIVSQALTLFTTPVIYLYLDSVADWLGRFSKKPDAPRPAPSSGDD